MKIEKIIFFMLDPFSERDFHRFGIETLQSHGFHVEIWSFSKQFSSDPKDQYSPRDPSHFTHQRSFADKKEAQQAIRSLDQGTLVMITVPCTYLTCWIYQSVSASQARYGIANPNAAATLGGTKASPWRHFKHPFQTLRKVPVRVFEFLAPQRWGVRAPDLALVGGREALRYYKNIVSDQTRILWTHTLDYDLFLKAKDIPSSQAASEKPYAVFIDQYLPYHPDFALAADKKMGKPEDYYRDLNRALDFIEDHEQIPIVVAAHPRSSYADADKAHCFPARRIVYDDLRDLVKDTKFVVAHYSTGLNFAVIYEKPVIFIYNASMQNHGLPYRATLEAARCFGKQAHDLTHSATLDWAEELTIDRKAYQAFRENYIKRAGTPEQNTWVTFCEALKLQEFGHAPS